MWSIHKIVRVHDLIWFLISFACFQRSNLRDFTVCVWAKLWDGFCFCRGPHAVHQAVEETPWDWEQSRSKENRPGTRVKSLKESPSYGKLPILLFPYHSHVFRGSYGSARSDFAFFLWGEYLINEIGTPIAKSSPRECLNRNRWTNVAIVSCVFRPEKVKDRPPQVFRIQSNEITAALSGTGWFCSLQTIDWMMRSEWMLYLYVFAMFHANERFMPQEDEHRTDNPSRTWLQSVKPW